MKRVDPAPSEDKMADYYRAIDAGKAVMTPYDTQDAVKRGHRCPVCGAYPPTFQRSADMHMCGRCGYQRALRPYESTIRGRKVA